MIIDKVQPFWTEEDKRKQEEYRQKLNEFLDELRSVPEPTPEEPVQIKTPLATPIDQWNEYANKMEALREDVIQRYIKSFARNKSGILADVREIVDSIERKDFTDTISGRVAMLANIKEAQPDLKGEELDKLTAEATESYSTCYSFLEDVLAIQFRALVYYGMDASEAEAIIDRRVRQLGYDKPEQPYQLMTHGKGTDAIAYISKKHTERDRITGALTAEALGVRITTGKSKKTRALVKPLSVNAHKLLSVGIQQFTVFNHTGEVDGRALRYDVAIPFSWYADKCGYDIAPHITAGATEEEKASEEKRAQKKQREVMKKIREDIVSLMASGAEWEETIHGKTEAFKGIGFISTSYSVGSDYIRFSLDPTYANYLIRLPLTYYPTALLGIDARSRNAYTMGLKMAEYFNIDNNQIRGTAQQLKVRTLLSCTDLPTIQDVKKRRGSWEERIKEPFEVALETLRSEGVIEDWYYSHPKGVRLTDPEAESIDSYEGWEDLLVYFTLKDAPDHADRIEGARERAREKAKEKRAQKRKKKASTGEHEG